MRNFTLFSTNLAVMLAALLAAEPARAAYVTFVSSIGSGTACTQAAPCSFQAAHDATFERGEIHCLDSGSIVGVTITKSITIDCAGFATITNFIVVDGPGIIVTIRNLTVNGVFGSGAGIDFTSGAALLVENCVVENYNSDATSVGIKFRPSTPGSKLVVTDTVVGAMRAPG